MKKERKREGLTCKTFEVHKKQALAASEMHRMPLFPEEALLLRREKRQSLISDIEKIR